MSGPAKVYQNPRMPVQRKGCGMYWIRRRPRRVKGMRRPRAYSRLGARFWFARYSSVGDTIRSRRDLPGPWKPTIRYSGVVVS